MNTVIVVPGLEKLFTTVRVGPFKFSHRVVLAPLSRMRTFKEQVPDKLMAEYYAQRATEGGLMIAESAVVSPDGCGYYGAPGIYNDAQVAGWKKVVDAVHAKGGIIFLQLFHAGRQSHADLQPGNVLPVGPSAIFHEDYTITADGLVPVTQNRALDLVEVPSIIASFRSAAESAVAAGFDGVELHAANGYLVDQFLQDGANQRNDIYGGSIEKRTRFLLEVVNALSSVWDAHRVGVRLAPGGSFGTMSDSDPVALFDHVVAQLNRLGLAYLHLIEPRVAGSYVKEESLGPVAAMHLRQLWNGPLISAGGFERAAAEEMIIDGYADMIAFGRDFLANPDLPYRLQNGLPLNAYDRNTFYSGGAQGYTDYPFYKGATKNR